MMNLIGLEMSEDVDYQGSSGEVILFIAQKRK